MKLIKIALGALFFIALPSVVFASVNITDNETGGDCATVAFWNNATKTCTLTADSTENIFINSDNITLDGAGFKIATSTKYVNGVEVYANSVTVKNLKIENFRYGIVLHSSSKTIMENNTISGTQEAICFYDSYDNKISSNTFLNNLQTIVFFNSNNNLLKDNHISMDLVSSTRYQGIVFFYSNGNLLDGNSITLKDGINTKIHQAIVFFASHDNTLTNNILADTYQKIIVFNSNGNIITKNSFSGAFQSLLLFDSNNNKVYNNNFTNNGTHAVDSKGVGNVFNLPLPEGGNYWDNFNEPVEGCLDGNNDNLCDSPYIYTSGKYIKVQDNYPWKIPNGWAVPQKPKYSNVAFLPGLEASRLYKQGVFFENKLWEPNRNADVEKLYLRPDGTPQNNDIYTRDAIDSVYGILNNVYAGFENSMQKLVDDGTINEFEVLPYDWRFQLDDILASGKKIGEDGSLANISYTQATTSPYIIQEIERLAKNSDTGKVAIVAHSNGGLLAKRLMEKLAEKGEANIIDKIIFVASPQSGTPMAVASLLHGLDQNLGFGFVMKTTTARTLAENMPSGYNLLPDQKYFADVSTPVVSFGASTSVTQSFRDTYGLDINNRTELKQFLLGLEGRTKPTSSDTDNPNILNSVLLSRAEVVQNNLDVWVPPTGVDVVQIAGWGEDTLSGINYKEQKKNVCSANLSVCLETPVLDLQPNFTKDGDGTVVIPSAVAMGSSAVESYYVDLRENNRGFSTNRKHADILEISQLRDLIRNIILGETTLPQYITTAKPLSTESSLQFSVHSPVSLDLYDTEGNHTGIVPNPNADSDIPWVEENIPNSYYLEIGEGKYAGSDTSAVTHIKLVGQSIGTFTLKVDEVVGDAVIGSLEFKDVPVMANSIITMDIKTIASASLLQIDIDGDGTNDFSFSPLDTEDNSSSFDIFSKIIQNTSIKSPYKEELVKDIEKIQKFIAKKEQRNLSEMSNAFLNLEMDIQKFVKKGIITNENGGQLLQIVGTIKNGVVK